MLNIEKTFDQITAMGPMHLKVFTYIMQMLTDQYQVSMLDFDLEKSIFFYGIDSLKIIEIHSTLEGQLNTKIPTEAFFQANTFKEMIDDIVKSISNQDDPGVKTSNYSLQAEIEEALEYLLRDRGDGATENQGSQTNTTLLTGASGFVGTFFLKELLERTDLKVFCLVRAADEEAGLKRIKKTALKYNAFLPSGWENRVQIVIGDMSKKRFGLPESVYEDYAQKIDSVYHVAAVDNFYLPYNIIKKTNVVGTIEVADFALFRKVKPFYHVSSCAVSLLEKCSDPPTIIGLVNGYAQTKYVTEQIILRLAEKGLPWISFRLGYLYTLGISDVDLDPNISLNKLLQLVTKTYEGVEDDFFIEADAFENFLMSISEIGCVPDMDANFDLIPVEYGAKAIIKTSLLPMSEKKDCYTFYNPHPLNWSDVISHFKKIDKRIETVPLTTFVDKYQEYVRQTNNNSIKLLKSVVSRELDQQFNTMFCKINTDIVKEDIHWCPPCEKQFTNTYVDVVLNG
ncbi:SDR family oxidoreductase [Aphanothece sacrum]|uniref:Polyketide synthase n=1 Tax=Aphanothece sacrum FPU1 TaxID=1920663 RepID=A0A401IM56_APHSA|nr:SDR family oxidoreductase [Aphanothece sacrum]GBF82342.1 polyketide synthase [Aphanothece sacrum FPU1]GBF84242.1 polyketide synthase [Aphanothece sacrum FPU3]